MVLLHDQLAQKAFLSVLYSSVGDFYAHTKRSHPVASKSLGWRIVSPNQVVWPFDVAISTLTSTPKLSTILRNDLQTICQRDANLLKQEVTAFTRSAFAILPTDYQIKWFLERYNFYASISHTNPDNLKAVDNWGAQFNDINSVDWAFAIWTYDLPSATLEILRMRCSTGEQLNAILSTAQQAARDLGMKRITAWNVDANLLNAQWQNIIRSDNLPAFAWYGETLEPEIWLANEHWGWC